MCRSNYTINMYFPLVVILDGLDLIVTNVSNYQAVQITDIVQNPWNVYVRMDMKGIFAINLNVEMVAILQQDFVQNRENAGVKWVGMDQDAKLVFLIQVRVRVQEIPA